MSDTLIAMLALTAGLLLGAMFYGGLWWTTRRGVASKRAVLWFLGSLILRMAVALSGFYLVSGGKWEPLLPCLAGFVAARWVVMRLTRPRGVERARSTSEARHAP